MAKKPKLDKVKLVKEMARDRVGQPSTEKVVPNKRKQRLDEIHDREAREDE